MKTMADVKTIVGNDGKLLGFNVDGRIIDRDTYMNDDLSMRKLEIELLGEVLMKDFDKTSEAALGLIARDDTRLRDLHNERMR